MAVGSMWRARGGPDIIGKVWCSQMLNVLAEYVSSRYFSNFSRFSSVAGYGSVVGRCGGGACVWLLPWPACPGWMRLIGPVESRPGLTPGRCRSTGSGTVWSL